MICVLTGIRLPEVLNNSFQKIGQTATPLAMIYLGGVFACIRCTEKYPETGLLWNCHPKNAFCFPLFFYVLLGYLPVSSEIRTTMALTSAMPVMSSMVMMANAYGSDGDYAMGGILVTTICSDFYTGRQLRIFACAKWNHRADFESDDTVCRTEIYHPSDHDDERSTGK